MQDAPDWLKMASAYVGIAEIKGPQHNSTILTLLDAADGVPDDGKTVGNIRDDETAWCASFVSAILELTGIKSARSAWARSYLNWGIKLPGPAQGAIAVLERGPNSGHVAFVAGRTDAGGIVLLGGNQSDMVRLSAFDTQRVIGYRWPSGVEMPQSVSHLALPIVVVSSSASEA